MSQATPAFEIFDYSTYYYILAAGNKFFIKL
jgi:hypothetical protein